MFHRILVAVDLSPESDAIFERALFLAKTSHAQLTLFHMVNVEEEENLDLLKLHTLEKYPWSEEEGLTCYLGHPTLELSTATDSPVLHFLQSHVKRAAVEQLNTDFVICLGANAGEAICTFALNWQADLIVIGHRGRSGLAELLLGSVSNYVVHHAPCSVHVVNRHVQSPSARSHGTSHSTTQP